MTRPTIAVTMWRRSTPTFIYDDTLLHTLVDDYAVALDRAGAVMLLVGPLRSDDVNAVLDRVDGLVVTGGGDFDPAGYGAPNTHSVEIEPTADERDVALVLGAQRRKIPVLGICRGLQAINIALGGSLKQEVNGDSEDHPTLADSADARNAHRHTVLFADGCRMATIYGPSERKVNSLHHQAADRIGAGIRVVGTTADANVEAIESTDSDWPVMAVQWHPEMMDDPAEDRLFEAFVADAVSYRNRRRETD
ncbi:MAG: gamma-glutamyl-gamma-aminobutyrate hydrolase family protein [Acidimicrobiia bacterium]|nr:gamma-glutamyl-gamma-aminobutyrate hydrolase family protein [Acidimicrobiia bacterium]